MNRKESIVGIYHYKPDNNDQLISELILPHTNESYKEMLAKIKNILANENKKRFRYIRYITYICFFILVLDALLVNITGSNAIIRDNFSAGLIIVQIAGILFIIGGLLLLLIRMAVFFSFRENIKAIKLKKLTPENPIIFKFYDTGIAFKEPHQHGSLYWQAFTLIELTNDYLYLSLCPENTEKGKETAVISDLFILTENLSNVDSLISLLSHEYFLSSFTFRDNRKKK